MFTIPGTKNYRYNSGEQLVLARKVVVDHRFGDAGLFGYLKGGGTAEPLFGEQQGGRLDDVLSFQKHSSIKFHRYPSLCLTSKSHKPFLIIKGKIRKPLETLLL